MTRNRKREMVGGADLADDIDDHFLMRQRTGGQAEGNYRERVCGKPETLPTIHFLFDLGSVLNVFA